MNPDDPRVEVRLGKTGKTYTFRAPNLEEFEAYEEALLRGGGAKGKTKGQADRQLLQQTCTNAEPAELVEVFAANVFFANQTIDSVLELGKTEIETTVKKG